VGAGPYAGARSSLLAKAEVGEAAAAKGASLSGNDHPASAPPRHHLTGGEAKQFHLFAAAWPPAWTWLAAAGYLLFIAMRARVGWRRLPEERKQRARLTLPENPAQMGYWIPISLLAGVTEEYAYRGVAYSVLSQITGSPGISLVVCVLSFGIAHMMQGWRATLGIVLLAILFHITVFLTEGLYLVIAFHVAYDLVIGILGMRALAALKPPEVQPAI
jgi:membrane protease YdiL (CAAX protease family)